MTSVTTHEFPSLVGGVSPGFPRLRSIRALLCSVCAPHSSHRLADNQSSYTYFRAYRYHHIQCRTGNRSRTTRKSRARYQLPSEFNVGDVLPDGVQRRLSLSWSRPHHAHTHSPRKCNGASNRRGVSWIRRWLGATSIMLWVSFALSIIAGAAYYKQAIRSGTHSALEQQLRYASTAIALLLLIGLPLGALCVIPRVQKTSIFWLVAMVSLLTVVCIYRLVAMNNWTTSLESSAPGSLNSPDAKAVCYVLHIAPEYLSAALLVGLNVRRVFATGLWGDISSLRPRRS